MPAKYAVEIAQAAERDLQEIWAFIALDDPAAAERFIARLERMIGTLEAFPERCPSIPENKWLGTWYQHLRLGRYRIIFRIAGHTVLVLRVVHGARQLDSSWFDEVTP